MLQNPFSCDPQILVRKMPLKFKIEFFKFQASFLVARCGKLEGKTTEKTPEKCGTNCKKLNWQKKNWCNKKSGKIQIIILATMVQMFYYENHGKCCKNLWKHDGKKLKVSINSNFWIVATTTILLAEHIIIITKKYDGSYSTGRTVVVVILCHKKSWLSAFAILIKKALLCQTTSLEAKTRERRIENLLPWQAWIYTEWSKKIPYLCFLQLFRLVYIQGIFRSVKL